MLETLAQLVEHTPFKRRVRGSNPLCLTNFYGVKQHEFDVVVTAWPRSVEIPYALLSQMAEEDDSKSFKFRFESEVEYCIEK